MTVAEAEMAAEVGAAAIVVSNHGGRIIDHTSGVAEVLPVIAKAVGNKLTIMADGGVCSSVDVIKYWHWAQMLFWLVVHWWWEPLAEALTELS
jgi:isopentenyl diphosphate isomerase/L-lactate dehydrogenase-like FMN-dependent dehydrogenase